jgi:hypothetical protein
MIALAACGPSGGEGSSDESAGSDSSSSSAATSASSIDDGGATEGASGQGSSSSADAESSSSDGGTVGTTGEPSPCDCADTEICIEISTDGCFEPHTPNTYCMPLPDACAEEPLECDNECGWEICGGPLCSGAGEVCGHPSPGFVCGGFSTQCNLFAQDCMKGDKCSSWANDGTEQFNTTRCAPIAENPIPVGGACTSESSHLSGIDDCVLGAMCLSDDPTATEGICRAACIGNPFDASCADPQMQCVLEGDYFGWCLPA